jgi:hypothetical protein
MTPTSGPQGTRGAHLLALRALRAAWMFGAFAAARPTTADWLSGLGGAQQTAQVGPTDITG